MSQHNEKSVIGKLIVVIGTILGGLGGLVSHCDDAARLASKTDDLIQVVPRVDDVVRIAPVKNMQSEIVTLLLEQSANMDPMRSQKDKETANN